MHFHSFAFIFLFLPLCLLGYWILYSRNRTAGKICLIAASIVFYCYNDSSSVVAFGISVAVNYFMIELMICFRGRSKLILTLAVLGNIGLLFWYKYYPFAAESVYKLTHVLLPDVPRNGLPLGISFVTFQQISILLAVYRFEIKDISILDYLAFILFFPKLLMGPLTEPATFLDQLNEKRRDLLRWDELAKGIKLFSFGLFKKVIFADVFSRAVAWGYSNMDAATGVDWALIMLTYSLEIYFDFSGYSDMAIGLASMFSIELPANFDSPYRALSIREFWKRWHISLTQFFTKNVYIPFGGNRRGRVATCCNCMIVFLLSGLWHGASLTFLLWGVLHGILVVLERMCGNGCFVKVKPLRWVFTFLTVNILWLLFRSDSIIQWLGILRKVVSMNICIVSPELMQIFYTPEFVWLSSFSWTAAILEQAGFVPVLSYITIGIILCLLPRNAYHRREELSANSMLLASAAFVMSVISLSGESVFIYSNF